MDHSAPITLNANQGRRRATKRCPPMRAVAKPSKPKLAPRSQKWPLGHRRGTMPRCATATVPTASHTSQAPISTTEDANSASAALHASPCAALRPRSSLLTYIAHGDACRAAEALFASWVVEMGTWDVCEAVGTVAVAHRGIVPRRLDCKYKCRYIKLRPTAVSSQ